MKAFFVKMRVEAFVENGHACKGRSGQEKQLIRNKDQAGFDGRVIKDRSAVNGDLAFIRLVNAADQPQKGGLPGTVGTNHAVNGAFFNTAADITQSRNAAESFDSLLYLNHDQASSLFA